MARKLPTISFANQAKSIMNKYKKRVDAGDKIAKSSMEKELDTLAQKQELVRSEQLSDDTPATTKFGDGGGLTHRARYYGATSDNPDELNEMFANINATDAKSMRDADKIYEKYQSQLNAIRNSKGDLTDVDIRRALPDGAYKELQTAYDTLTGIAEKYDIPAQSFGINDTDTGSTMPQFFGRRFADTTFDVTGPEGKPVVTAKAPQQIDPGYERFAKDIDPYQIDPRFDIGSTVAASRPLLETVRPDQVDFDRVAPGYVNYENARQQARQDATTARNVALANIRRTAGGAGQAASNALATQTGLQSNLNRVLVGSQEAEANRNAALFGQNQAQNAAIQRAEALKNYEDRRYTEEGNVNRRGQVGRNTAALMQRLKQNEYNELGLQSNPDYAFDTSGNYVSRFGYKPIDQQQIPANQAQIQAPINQQQVGITQPPQAQPYIPEVPNLLDQGFIDPEIDRQLVPIQGQPSLYDIYRCGGKLNKKRR